MLIFSWASQMMSSKSEALNESRLVVLIRTLSIKINKELPFQHHELETQKLRGNYNTSATIIESKIYQRCTQSACRKRVKTIKCTARRSKHCYIREYKFMFKIWTVLWEEGNQRSTEKLSRNGLGMFSSCSWRGSMWFYNTHASPNTWTKSPVTKSDMPTRFTSSSRSPYREDSWTHQITL
jgi:hypothetical protein